MTSMSAKVKRTATWYSTYEVIFQMCCLPLIILFTLIFVILRLIKCNFVNICSGCIGNLTCILTPTLFIPSPVVISDYQEIRKNMLKKCIHFMSIRYILQAIIHILSLCVPFFHGPPDPPTPLNIWSSS